ncbi:S8 family serine peptidase [Anaerofustis stercorihominis]|uniref:Peptidase S8/S53 domain-containing protein n=1 Tax=Anaerofustis stercorihominis TaxID=214853 RepID=A0A3E3E1S5_9FIRM|nr:S8 family serine peptidase [Anaerofustis stercorihominis]RGD75514.1 hypothetical protein DW687_04095 [Anaerofustis stercorihominis]
MKNKKIIYTLLSILLILLFTNTVYAQNKADEKYDPNSVLVVFKDNISNSKKSRILSNENLNIEETVDKKENIELVEVPKGSTVEETIKTLNDKNEVLYAQPNFKYKALATTNDPLLSAQKHLTWTNISGSGTTAWNYSTGENTKIAIFDTGAYTSNPDLSNIKGTYNASTGSSAKSSVVDYEGHGTHVAGIAAACGNNKSLGAGVAYNSDLYIAKVADSNGDISSAYLIRAFDWAEEQGCRIINMSLGGYGYEYDSDGKVNLDLLLKSRIDDAYNKSNNSILTVCAAGNGDDINGYPYYSYPSDFPNSYSVVALQYDSNGNPTRAKYSDYNEYKDIAAPGSNINSLSNTSTSKLITESGTSMAAPFVSGVAGLIMSKVPDLTAKEVVDIINSTANKIGSYSYSKGRNNYYGYGEINPLKAIKTAIWKKSSMTISKTSDIIGENKKLDITLNMYTEVPMKVEVYDSNNNLINTLADKTFTAGETKLSWDYSNYKGDKYSIQSTMPYKNSKDKVIQSKTFNLCDLLDITGLSSSYTPLANTSITGNLNLNTDCTVSAGFYDKDNKLVKTIYNKNTSLTKGNKSFSWNYLDDNNKLIPSGTYEFKVSATSGDITKEYSKNIKITIPEKASISKMSVTSSIKRNDFNKASIKYTLNNQCVTSIKIYNSSNTLIKSISGNRKGSNTEYWNLKDNKGNLVAAGTYKVIMSGYNISGKFETTKYIKITNPSKVSISKFKNKSKVIRASGYYTSTKFYLNEDARVKVLLTTTKNKKLKTLKNVVMKKGTNTVKWNLKSTKGNVYKAGKYKIVIYATNSRNTYQKSSYVTLIKKKPSIKVSKVKSSYKIRGSKNNPTIKVKTNTIAKVTVRVYNRKNKLIKTITKNKTYKTGTYKFKWNGKSGKNKKVSKTKYYFKVTIKNENGSKTVKTKQFKYK